MQKIPSVPPVGLLNLSRKKQIYYEHSSHNNSSMDFYNDNYNYDLYNICYMNSVIQCLFRLDKFVANILVSEGKNLLNASKDLLIKMINYKADRNIILSVEKIKKAIEQIDERYKNNNCEDVNEFISNYLDGLLEETKHEDILVYKENSFLDYQVEKPAYIRFFNRFYSKKGDSFILDLFYGELKMQKICSHCKALQSIQFSAFNILELPIYELAKINQYSPINLKDILKEYISENKNNEDICNICHTKSIYSKTEIFKLPKYLIIYFGRTVENDYISSDINFPSQMDFYDFIYKKDEINTYDNVYNLKSVIYYYSIRKKLGHYTASCKCDYKEYYFDDSEVIEKTKANILGNPIILFYENIKA